MALAKPYIAPPVDLQGVNVSDGADWSSNGGFPSDTTDGGGGGGGYFMNVVGPFAGGSGHTTSSTTTTAKAAKSKASCPAKQSDPIMLDTGTKVETVTDFALPGEMGWHSGKWTVPNVA